MTDPEIRIAVAEERGWTEIKEYHYHDADGIDGINPKSGERDNQKVGFILWIEKDKMDRLVSEQAAQLKKGA